MVVGPDLLDPDRAAALARPVPRRRRRQGLVTVLAVLGFVLAVGATTVSIRALERAPAVAEQNGVPTPDGWTRLAVSDMTFIALIRPAGFTDDPGVVNAFFFYLEKDLTWRPAGQLPLPGTTEPVFEVGAGTSQLPCRFSLAVFPSGSTSIGPVFTGDVTQADVTAQVGTVTVSGVNHEHYLAVAVVTTPKDDITRLRGFAWVDEHGRSHEYSSPR